MRQFEYKFKHDKGKGREVMERYSNWIGKKGWELIQVKNTAYSVTLCFKREIEKL